jgi:hypothetical protein
MLLITVSDMAVGIRLSLTNAHLTPVVAYTAVML